MNDSLIAQLETLHTAELDAQNGYERALEDSNSPQDFVGLFRDMIEVHRDNAQAIHAELRGLGVRESDSGSFMSVVHRTIMDVRSLLGGLNATVLPGLIDGETRNIEKYDDALRENAMTEEFLAVLRTARDKLSSSVSRMKAMKAAGP